LKVSLFTLIALLGLSTVSHTHELRPAYLELQAINEDTFSVTFKVPGRGQQKRLALYLQLPEDIETITPVKTTSALQ